MKICYASIIRQDKEDSKWWNVSIPDVWGAVTCGDSYENALFMAKDLLSALLETSPKQFGFPTPIEETKKNFPDEIIEPIEIDIDISSFEFNDSFSIKESEPKTFCFCNKKYKIYGSLFDYKNSRIFVLSNKNKMAKEVKDYSEKYKLLQYARSIIWEKITVK